MLHVVGLFIQALIKRLGRVWPNHVPGNQIDEYMNDKSLGYEATLKERIDGKDFLIHCLNDDCFITKFMRTHKLIHQVTITPTGISMAHGKHSNMCIQCHLTIIQNTGLMISIIGNMIPLVWKRFG